ncbi:hypothetical protein EI94DRAFT_1769823 [Lactarius quietus]|nr:hypothetical protein EI94DRAFT_1769823 [Lactarius quietus]
MKYIALLSGGKDSCYNLVHCQKNGHELVAVASLGPEPGKEELDSYLYQTVGQDAIEFVASALDVPLYRRVISGSALAQGSEYDETEDLHALLADVKSQHPDASGVAVGAILSNYQRVRVEHVCQRLSLTPLSYLWQRNQAELLSEMIASGLEAILIKVAGIGLTTEHLGKSLSEMQPTLTKLNTLYGAHICGEGGEYETLTLDCPLFKRRITLLETETAIHSDNNFPDIAVPALLDQPYCDVEKDIQARIAEGDGNLGRAQRLNHPDWALGSQLPVPTSRCMGNWIAIGNIHRESRDISDVPLDDEIRECFHILQKRLSEHSLSLSQIANMNIFISSMEDFASINAVYSTYFGVSPPARACVAVDLPAPLRLMLDCIAYSEQKASDRQALHVQGLSYWAPANIGPYSQAVIVDERVFVSGQIGLVPSSLAFPFPRSPAIEISLVSQHADRVVEALLSNNSGDRHEGHAQMILYWLTQERHVSHAIAAAQSLDPGSTPSLFLVVKDLPKGALIEKQVLYHTGRGFAADDDGDIECVPHLPLYGSGDSPIYARLYDSDAETDIRYEVAYLERAGASAMVICGRGSSGWKDALRRLETAAHIEGRLAHSLSMRLSSLTRILDHPPIPSLFNQSGPAITPVPCRSIRTRDQSDWDYALCILTT